jgi:hypothetical protein
MNNNKDLLNYLEQAIEVTERHISPGDDHGPGYGHGKCAGPKGEKGDVGSKGPEGPKGPRGNKGNDLIGHCGEPGPEGSVGDKGPLGNLGLSGSRGLTGATGDNGPCCPCMVKLTSCNFKDFHIPNGISLVDIHIWGKGGDGGLQRHNIAGGGGGGGACAKFTISVNSCDMLGACFDNQSLGHTKVTLNGVDIYEVQNGEDADGNCGGKGGVIEEHFLGFKCNGSDGSDGSFFLGGDGGSCGVIQGGAGGNSKLTIPTVAEDGKCGTGGGGAAKCNGCIGGGGIAMVVLTFPGNC